MHFVPANKLQLLIDLFLSCNIVTAVKLLDFA